MLAWLVVVLAVGLQLAAVLIALRLIRITGRSWAWLLLAAALSLMVLRRVVPLLRWLGDDSGYEPDLSFELVGLAISAGMFAGIALLVPVFRAIQRTEQLLLEHRQKMEHVNAVLRGIRDVNQLIAREKERDPLLRGVCARLVESRGYRHAWIILYDGQDRLCAAAQAGLDERFELLCAQLTDGKSVACLPTAMAVEAGVLFVRDATHCGGCPLAGLGEEGRTIVAALEVGQGTHGILAGCLDSQNVPDDEERALFSEVAGDVALALRSLQADEERRRAERGLRLNEARLEALVKLNGMLDTSLQALTDFVLEEAVRLTESRIGYLAFVNEDESVLTMHSWSKTAMAECRIIDKPIVYPVATTGLWGEAVRQRKPVITNDYPAPNPLKKGHPDGHVAVTRHMNLPVFEGERIVIVAGVGNKEQPYDEADVRQLRLLMQGMWQLLQRKRAVEEIQAAHRRMQNIIEFLPDATFVIDHEKRVIAWNRAMEEMTGVPQAEMLGKGEHAYSVPFYGERLPLLIDLLDGDDAETAARYAVLERRNHILLAERFLPNLHGGKGAHVWIAAAPLLDSQGQRYGAIEAVRDITDRKRAEDALQKAHDELELRVDQRTAELARTNVELLRAKEAAEAASRAKSTFLANMSHEIRTPLNAVIGMTELVLKSQLSTQQREFLTTVRDAGEALLSVINDILDFSKIEAGKLSLDCRPFNLWESLGDTLKSFALRAHQQGLELACYVHPEVPHMLLGDYARLRQVVVNLVGNALKFTERGEVVVEVWCESMTPPDVVLRFSVTDTGIGIPADKLGSVFEMFEQADTSTTRRHGGTGLGLAIAARLVEMMGGSVSVQSELGRGSRFQFQVRLGLADPAHPLPEPPEPPSLHGLRVLVVDDNATNRRILEEVLHSWQMQPTTARSAAEALVLMRSARNDAKPFQLVLTDAHMPRVDGFMLTEQIKQDAGLGSTIVMMLTSGDRPEDTAKCETLGIASYLLKPIKQSELLEAMELALGVTVTRPVAPEASPPPSTTVGHLRILLAEDSLVNQKLAVAMLQNRGHTVTVAKNGREAVDDAAAEVFDLVLMDVQMPELDGLEATAAIRAGEQSTGTHLPIIAMTAHALKGDRERCLNAGMDGYVSKPIRHQELFDAIDAVFAGKEPTAAAAPPDGEEVDLSEIPEAVRQDANVLRSVAEAASEELPRLMKQIREAVSRGDSALLQRAAHTLKGSLRYFAAKAASDHVLELETRAREGRLEGLEPLVTALDGELTTLTAALRRIVQRPSR